MRTKLPKGSFSLYKKVWTSSMNFNFVNVEFDVKILQKEQTELCFNVKISGSSGQLIYMKKRGCEGDTDSVLL